MTYFYLKKNTKSQPMQPILFARVSSAEQERGDAIDTKMKTVKDYCIQLLQILIPNSLLGLKKLVLSITKPFDAMLKSKNCEVWCAIEESNL